MTTEPDIPHRTGRDAILFELLGDVGRLNDAVVSLKNTFPAAANQMEKTINHHVAALSSIGMKIQNDALLLNEKMEQNAQNAVASIVEQARREVYVAAAEATQKAIAVQLEAGLQKTIAEVSSYSDKLGEVSKKASARISKASGWTWGKALTWLITVLIGSTVSVILIKNFWPEVLLSDETANTYKNGVIFDKTWQTMTEKEQDEFQKKADAAYRKK